jgi:hypothetical protein
MNISAQLNTTIVLHPAKTDCGHDWYKRKLKGIGILPTAMVLEV